MWNEKVQINFIQKSISKFIQKKMHQENKYIRFFRTKIAVFISPHLGLFNYNPLRLTTSIMVLKLKVLFSARIFSEKTFI